MRAFGKYDVGGTCTENVPCDPGHNDPCDPVLPLSGFRKREPPQSSEVLLAQTVRLRTEASLNNQHVVARKP